MIIPLETLAVFFVTSLLLALAPGPDILFVLAQSAANGKKAGICITFGLCTGLIVHTSAVALGVAVLFQTSMVAFTLLKGFGACYLLYLAWLAFRAPASEAAESTIGGRTDGRRLYLRGIIMNVSNPKVSIFFLAFLPQFADAGRGHMTMQLILLGVVFIGAALLVFTAVSVLAATIGQYVVRSTQAQKFMNRLAGTLFAALALKLACTEQ